MNALGIYMLVSLAFVVAAMAEFAVIVLLSRTTKNIRINARRDTISKKGKDMSAQLRRRIRKWHHLGNVTKKEKSNIASFKEDVNI